MSRVPVADLISALEQDALTEAAALVAGAHAEGERLRTGVAGDAVAARDAERARVHAELQGEADARVAAAAHDARARVLAARARALAIVHDAVRARLPELLQGPDGERLVTALIDAGLAATGDLPAVLRCPPALVAQVRARVGPRAQLCVEADPAAGNGVHLEVDGGRLRIDATLEAVLERAWPRLRIDAISGAGP